MCWTCTACRSINRTQHTVVNLATGRGGSNALTLFCAVVCCSVLWCDVLRRAALCCAVLWLGDAGAREVAAGSAEDLLRLLDVGTLTRATSGTLLNEQSSRSHAIFSIILEQTISRPRSPSNSSEPTLVPASGTSSSNDHLQTTNEPKSSNEQRLSQQGDADLGQASQMSSTAGSSSNAGDHRAVLDSSVDAGSGIVEYRCSKFHLVDLAGSERASRSGAAGMRFKETVNINQVSHASCPAPTLAFAPVASAWSVQSAPCVLACGPCCMHCALHW